MAVLDDESLSRVLEFVNHPVAALCCRVWSAYIYKSLQLQGTISFNRAMRRQGRLSYHHSTVRDLGGMEECVSYSFTFLERKEYSLHWFREGLTSDNEQHYGAWSIDGRSIRCETAEPLEQPDERYLRFAPPGRIFEVPIDSILSGASMTDTTESWELPARGLAPDRSIGDCPGDATDVVLQTQPSQVMEPPAPVNSHFVEIDGDVHRVSQDIVDNWPEADWVRLMRCRLRFGTGTERWP
eukprot:gb/GFBE01013364.1/.p1 GENE.gb/GFBE01013364.1/~~gb/GFBE01013364.1/.p1  ORF type:complete len:240 (+),score=29.25 gb/GFBE01013364.1/:1-720(+)